MTQNNKVLHGNTYCMGEWCNEKTDLISELPKEPFKTLKTCDEITYALKAGKVLSVNLSIACTPDYISYYHGIEGVMQILEGVFPADDEVLLDDLAHSKVMLTFGTNPVRGFSIPLLTVKLDFFPDSELCSLERIEEHLMSVTPTICGYMCETETIHLSSIEEIRGFVYLRMTSEIAFRFSREFRELLTKTDMLRWDWFVQSAPTVFYGENLIDFHESRVGQAMILTDRSFGDIFSNWGKI